MLRSTTKAQVSGHKFLQRRLEHGLVLGDCRMISDPLGRRNRAGMFGLIGSGLVALLSAGLALFAPAPHPGDAPLIADTGSQQLYVQVEGTYHPVTNLVSARLIAGQPLDPAPADPRYVRQIPKGPPVGLRAVPGSLGEPGKPGELVASTCMSTDGATIVLRIGPRPAEGTLPGTAVLAAGEAEYLLTADGRALLPQETTPEGRALRRGLGITASTPRWQLPAHAIEVFPELVPIALPPDLREVLIDPRGKGWGRLGAGVVPLSPAQVGALQEVLPTREITEEELRQLRDAPAVTTVPLPEDIGPWLDGGEGFLCAAAVDGGTRITVEQLDPAAAVPLVGEATATHLDGPGDIAVDSGLGFHVLSGGGWRHAIADPADVAALGVADPILVPWAMLRLLPAGQELSRAEAMRIAAVHE